MNNSINSIMSVSIVDMISLKEIKIVYSILFFRFLLLRYQSSTVLYEYMGISMLCQTEIAIPKG
jgi:hypothetical protein